jgi:hypothetical protein
MKLGRGALDMLLRQNAAELKFHRRHEKSGWANNRRMFCTKDMRLLESAPGKRILNYSAPAGIGLPYNAAHHNLVIVWDVFMQNWRAIPCESVEVVAVVKTDPPDKFWKYFMQKVHGMHSRSKYTFMNS